MVNRRFILHHFAIENHMHRLCFIHFFFISYCSSPIIQTPLFNYAFIFLFFFFIFVSSDFYENQFFIFIAIDMEMCMRKEWGESNWFYGHRYWAERRLCLEQWRMNEYKKACFNERWIDGVHLNGVSLNFSFVHSIEVDPIEVLNKFIWIDLFKWNRSGIKVDIKTVFSVKWIKPKSPQLGRFHPESV